MTKEKIILEIDTHINPWINEYDLSNNENIKILNQKLNLGYTLSSLAQITPNPENTLFNPFFENVGNLFEKNQNTFKSITDNLSGEISKIDDTIGKLIYSSANVSLKGKIGENIVFSTIQNYFPDWIIENTTGQTAEADYHITTNTNLKILLEVKMYTQNVNTAQVEKFRRDLKRTHLPVGIMLSCTSGISKKKKFEIEKIGDQIFIYIPNAGTDGISLIWALLLSQHLYQYNLKNKDNYFEIDKLYEIFEEFKDEIKEVYKLGYEIVKAKETIDNLFNNLIKSSQMMEAKTTLLIKNVDKIILDYLQVESKDRRDFEVEEFLNTLKNEEDKRFLDYVLLHNIIQKLNLKIKIEDDEYKWHICKEGENTEVAYLKVLKTKIELVFKKPVVTIVVNNDSEYLIKNILKNII